jgi:hypothetical protein
MAYRFKGDVKVIQALTNQEQENPTLKNHLDNFKEYWLEGFHPLVGKDIATTRPNPPEGHRHTHLHPGVFGPSKHWKASEDCWNKWGGLHYNSNNDAQDINFNQHPTSDTFLCYLIDEKRVAYVFHYKIDDGHEFLNSAEYVELVNKVAIGIEHNGQSIMGWESHHDLFESKWINDKSE